MSVVLSTSICIHCKLGYLYLPYRSATLVLAYLMKYHRMKLIDAHAYVKNRRPLIRPNAGFWKDLVDFEKKLFHKNTVDMVESKFGGFIYAFRIYEHAHKCRHIRPDQSAHRCNLCGVHDLLIQVSLWLTNASSKGEL